MTTPELRRGRRVVVLGLALALFVTLFVDVAVLSVPIYDMQLYDRVLLSRNMDTVAMLSVLCLAGLLIYGLLEYLRAAALIAIAEGFGQALRVAVLEAGVRQSLDGCSSAGSDALRDLNELRHFLSSGAVSVPLDVLCTPLLLAVMFMLHPAFGWLAVSGVSLLVIVGIVTDALVRPAMNAAAQQRTQAANQLAAGLRERDLTEGMGMLPALTRRWAIHQAAALGKVRTVGRKSDGVAAVGKVLRLSLQAGVMALGAVLILSTQASAGSLMGTNLLLNKVLGPFDALVASWRRWIAAAAAWKRVSAMLAAQSPAFQRAEPHRKNEGGLVLQGIGFTDCRTGRTLLHDIDLALPPGTATALVGPNGAGKSTLLRVIAGLLPPAAGSLRVGGVPMAAVDRTRIGYLPQGVYLLDGTVLENVGRFQNAPVERVVAATSAVGMHGIVGRLRRGYETPIGQSGLALSGGQQRRIGLARALFGEPTLLVLDEPDASLDSVGEDALLQAIDHARQSGAVVVVATHRAKLLATMDLVVTIRAGRVEHVAPGRAAAAVMRPRLQPASA